MSRGQIPRGKFPPELLQKIKEAVNLVEVVGEHVVLRKSGSNYTGLCPFHSERSPSFSVSEQKQLYHCYGCKKGGDLLSFVMEIHTLGFREAIEELAERGKIALPKELATGDSSEDPEAAKRREAAREKLALASKLNRFTAAFYHQSVSQVPHIDQYFRSRGVNADLMRSFYLGAAPASWDALSSHLVAKKAPLPLAVELGLIRPSQKGGRPGGPGYFDLFRNRAMFPIIDMRGKVAGFGGRALPTPPGAPDVGGESPKYLNSPESLLFHKSKLAFGLYQAQKHIREKDEVILVEGYFDVIALHAAGFQNVVATCGTALTPDHLQMFRRLGTRVTVLFDGDKAGVSALERAMEVGLDQGQVLYGATMPEGLDPDELLFDQSTGAPIQDGIERLKGILAAAQPLLDSRIDDAVARAAQGPEAQTQALKQIAGWLNRFKDPVGKEVRLQSLQTRMGLSPQLMARVLGGSGGAAGEVRAASAAPNNARSSQRLAPTGNRPAARRAGPGAKISNAEKILLAALARGGDFTPLFVEVRRNLPPSLSLPDLFDYPPARDFVTSLTTEPGVIERFRAAPEQILAGDLDAQVRSIITEALVSQDAPVQESEVKLALGHRSVRALEHFSQRIQTAIAAAEAKKDAELESSLKKEYLDVRRKMKEFSSFYDEA